MGRVGSQPHLLYTSPSLLDLSFLHRVPTQPIKLRQLSTIQYHTPYLYPNYLTHPAQCYPTAGLMTNKAKTTHQTRPKRPGVETTQAEMIQGRNELRPSQPRAETTRYRRWEKSLKPRVAAYNYSYPKFDFWISNIQHGFRISINRFMDIQKSNYGNSIFIRFLDILNSICEYPK